MQILKPTVGETSNVLRQVFQGLLEAEYVFILVNPSSGGGAAGALLNIEFNYLQFKLPNGGLDVKVHISDIRKGPSGNKPFFHIIKRVADVKYEKRNDGVTHSSKVRIIVAGGDGTAMWTLSEMTKHSIRPVSVYVGILPFGTGNDLANALGSQNVIFKQPQQETGMEMIQRLAMEYIQGFIPASLDIWGVNATLNSTGTFKRVDSATRKKEIVLDNDKRPATKLSFKMLNYFSVGVESRIGIGFDRNRTSHALLNRGAYAVEGFKKFAFHRTRFVNNIISKLTVQERCGAPINTVFRCRSLLSKTDKITSLFSRAPSMPGRQSLQVPTSAGETDEDEPTEIESGIERARSAAVIRTTEYPDPNVVLEALPDQSVDDAILSPCVSILFLNIPSFAGGLDVWSSAAGKLGVSLPPGVWARNDVQQQIAEAVSELSKQDFGDGKIEVIGFQSLMELSLSNLQRIVPREFCPSGWRLYQGGGQFSMPFKQHLNPKLRVYFQVDGEYYIAQSVKEICVSPQSRVQVLVRPDHKPDRQKLQTNDLLAYPPEESFY